MKIITFHGFLGNLEQFSFLKEKPLYHFPIDSFIHSTVKEMVEHIESILDGEKGILIGYSFGSRLSMQVFCEKPEIFDKLILMAGHAGLDNKEEKELRLMTEGKFINKLETLSDKEFVKWWNKLDLFIGDRPIELETIDQKLLINYFNIWGLSKQPCLLKKLETYKEKVHWYYGELDTKYCNYAKENLTQFNIKYIPNQGHRVYQSAILQKMIKDIL